MAFFPSQLLPCVTFSRCSTLPDRWLICSSCWSTFACISLSLSTSGPRVSSRSLFWSRKSRRLFMSWGFSLTLSHVLEQTRCSSHILVLIYCTYFNIFILVPFKLWDKVFNPIFHGLLLTVQNILPVFHGLEIFLLAIYLTRGLVEILIQDVVKLHRNLTNN